MAAELQAPIVVIDSDGDDDTRSGGGDSRENGNSEMKIAKFVKKLYEMVEEKDEAKTKSLVHWSSNGSSFIVTDPSLFATDVLPIYFKKCNKLQSFIRQLNYFGFKKKMKAEQWEYAHEYFQKGKWHLMENIRNTRAAKKPTDTTTTKEYREMKMEIIAFRKKLQRMKEKLDTLYKRQFQTQI